MPRETKRSNRNFRPTLRKVCVIVGLTSTIILSADKLIEVIETTPNRKFEDYALEEDQYDEEEDEYDDYHR